MTETAKTFALILVAAVLLILGFATRPSATTSTPEEAVGKALFPELSDPLKAKRMRIVTFDEDTSRAKEFEVAQINGLWSLPSHKNYPADAKDQMATAAGSLVDLKVLGVVTDNAREHELYGVVEPKPSEDQFGNTGVGKLVVMEGEGKKPLARLIIGKEDKSAAKPDELGGQPAELRFVRVQGQDRVYRVAIKTNKFSTKFADWIETDLLKLQQWDIASIKLRDYSVTDAVDRNGDYAPVLNKRADIDLAFDDKTAKWNLKELLEYKGRAGQEVKLADDEELDSAKLNELKNALNALKIMDVARKPEKMSANLKTDKSMAADIETRRDLFRRGFLAFPVAGSDQMEIVSNDGEVTVQMKDGVEYLLRFGAVAGIDNGTDDKKKTDEAGKAGEKGADGKTADAAADAKDPKEATDADGKAGDEKNKAGGLSRYIMVMAQFNENVLPKPELEPLPEIKKAAKVDEAKADAKKSDGKADAKSAKGEDKKGTAAGKSAKADEAKKDAAKVADTKAADPATEEDQEALEAQRDKIEKDNRRKQEAYDEKVKAGQAKAKELNSRFADWYYVVGDETYRKIHLNKADIVKKKTAADASAPAGHNAPANPFHMPGAPGVPGVGS